MKREGTIGAAAFLAIAALVGYSVQTGSKPAASSGASNSAVKHSKPSPSKGKPQEDLPGCDSLRAELEDFLKIEEKKLALPPQCFEPDDTRRITPPLRPAYDTTQLKFVIATLPDPVHTHFPVLFDQFSVAIQDGAQDENYDFDGSWLPWDDTETPYPLLLDEKEANAEKDLKENQPGIILFRKTVDCGGKDAMELMDAQELEDAQNIKNAQDLDGCRNQLKSGGPIESYRAGLIVFVVGEDATHGIHKEQFRNALAWIKALRPETAAGGKPLAILGPTFSGSLTSLTQLLSESDTQSQLMPIAAPKKARNQSGAPQNPEPPHPEAPPLAIYSGSVSSRDSAQEFQNTLKRQVVFHSFVQNDDAILGQFCAYIKKIQPGLDPGRIAIISEDETAYGNSGVQSEASACDRVLNLYYPPDISALRGAYQTKSLFDSGTAAQPTDAQRRNLPTDLADPTGNVHDSIRSYGGNQTPLAQEAFLMDMVGALRELHARYIILRGSNMLDQLFLSNFLQRSYPDGRIVIFSADLMFVRESGQTGLSGSMVLSTYPLFPLEHRWTDHLNLAAAERVFSSDTTEGTYVAFRLLLNDKSINHGLENETGCGLVDRKENEENVFLPLVICRSGTPIPDYSPPFWMTLSDCGEMTVQDPPKDCPYEGPSIWLSVIGGNRFWPIATLQDPTSLKLTTELVPPASPNTGALGEQRARDPGGRPDIPLGMKVTLLILVAFSMFHWWCCWAGSYTSKPAFRAHFASLGDPRHTSLIQAGSCCVAFLAVVTGWGCGVFSIPARGLAYPWLALCCVITTCVIACLSIFANLLNTREISKTLPSWSDLPRMTGPDFTLRKYKAFGVFISATGLFGLAFVLPLELALRPENRILTYWRAMHLASGVSPVLPILSILIALYLSFWFKLHGLALFGPDRPCLPEKDQLALEGPGASRKDFLTMFSQQDAADRIERAANAFDGKTIAIGVVIFFSFLIVPAGIAGGVPLRSLGADCYAIIFLVVLDICCSLALVEAWRLHALWEDLRRLLTFLDRLPLRRTLAALHGFSWGSVWKMSGNVLDVRYKLISRQMECMNHLIAILAKSPKDASDPAYIPGAQSSLDALTCMQAAGVAFADWYSKNYLETHAGDLASFHKFQKSVATVSGALLAKLLVPAWRKEKVSLNVVSAKDDKDDAAPKPPLLSADENTKAAEEFVCLNYLGFVQNVLGRIRTMAMTIMVLIVAATVAISTYPFDPRQPLSIVLIVLFAITGWAIVKVYAEMHRDSTLSHVTNTNPGELGAEFWFKIVGFGFAPLIGLLTRIFPSVADFLFSWLQPGISSLK